MEKEQIPPVQEQKVKSLGVRQMELYKDFENLSVFMSGEAEPSTGDVRRALKLEAEMIKVLEEPMIEQGDQDWNVIMDKIQKLKDFTEKHKDLL